MSKTIHIGLASDDNYFEGLLVTTVSIANSCSRAFDITFHVLDGGISNLNWQFLIDTLKPFGSVVEQIPINQSVLLKDFGTWHGDGHMAYARLLLPNLMPETPFVIYTDVDIIWHDDVAKLWDERDCSCLMQCVRLYTRPDVQNSLDQKWIEAQGFPYVSSKYFCSGMILLNLEKFREEALHNKMIQVLIKAGGDAPYADQSVLNAFAAIRPDIGYLPSHWQVTTDTPSDCLTSNAVIHYAGDTPWKPIKTTNHFLTDLHLLWHRYHAKIRGISTWRSLRTYNSTLWIIFGRLLYMLSTNLAPVRFLIRAYLSLTNRTDAIPAINAVMTKVPKISPRF